MEYVARKSNLVVPEGFVELDREEMTYVDGGVSFNYYLSNADAWAAVTAVTGLYQNANMAVIAGSGAQATLISLCVSGIKQFAFAAKIGAIPVVGWVALGILCAAAVSVATVLVGCLVSGKGFEINFNWDPKWYNPFNGLSLNMGWK